MRRDRMLREEELVELAETYREMAKEARDAQLRFDFAERAERYETGVRAVRRKAKPTDQRE